jgi:uncharacterized protein with FMN-binding domain
MNNSHNSTYVRAIAIVAIIVLAGGALAYSLLGKKPTAITAATSTSSNIVTSTSTSVQTSKTSSQSLPAVAASSASQTYKDGTYSATGSYISPGGDEKIGVTLTLKDDVITSASVNPESASSEGRQYQGIFQQNFQPLVIGKNISDVHLTTVSGSSLTSGGFNQALALIETQAKA